MRVLTHPVLAQFLAVNIVLVLGHMAPAGLDQTGVDSHTAAFVPVVLPRILIGPVATYDPNSIGYSGRPITCYDMTNPPPPDAVSWIERSVYGSLLRYNLANRWPGATGTPVTLTWSFIPDGTIIPGDASIGAATSGSSLFATMDAKFGGNRSLWMAQFQAVFSRWAALTGTQYARVQFNSNPWDDGAAFPMSSGAPDLRGDIRIGAHSFAGPSGVLAYNFLPVDGGDMVLDSTENWGNSAGSYLFTRNTLAHEHGHGLGLLHVCPVAGSVLMEPILATNFDGPQHDDLRAAQSLYGDAFESNDTIGTATNLGNFLVGTTVAPTDVPAPAIANGSKASLGHDGDEDIFRVIVAAPLLGTVSVEPVGTMYGESPQVGNSCPGTNTVTDSLTQADLAFDILNSTGTVLYTQSAAAVGTQETLANILFSPPGDLHIRVRETNSPTGSQLYRFTVVGNSTPTVSASDGTFPDKVRVSWSAISNLTQFAVLRGSTATRQTASVIGVVDGSATSFDDLTALGGTYYYWLEGTSLAGSGSRPIAGPVAGKRQCFSQSSTVSQPFLPEVWLREVQIPPGIGSPYIISVDDHGNVRFGELASQTTCSALPAQNTAWYPCGYSPSLAVAQSLPVSSCTVYEASGAVTYTSWRGTSVSPPVGFSIDGLSLNGTWHCPAYGPLATQFSTFPYRLDRFFPTDSTATGDRVVGILDFHTSSSIGRTTAAWTLQGGLTPISAPIGTSAELRMSDDGSVVAGTAYPAAGTPSAFISRAPSCVQAYCTGLGTSGAGVGTAGDTRILDVSGDGKTLVGLVAQNGQHWSTGVAVRWIDDWRAEAVDRLLTTVDPRVVVPPGWRLNRAQRTSTSGEYLAGFAYVSATGQERAWVAKVPPAAGIIFRYASFVADGTDQADRWSHIGIYSDGKIWESHPGYTAPFFLDRLRNEYVDGNPSLHGVMNLHTLGSFQSVVPSYRLVSMNMQIVEQMAEFAAEKSGSEFIQYQPSYADPALLARVASPEIQKGRQIHPGCVLQQECPGQDVNSIADDQYRFSSVGLVEAAAESAGVNGGQGFVPDSLEGIDSPWGRIPLLSPDLLAWCLGDPEGRTRVESAFQGTPVLKGWIYGQSGAQVTDSLSRAVCADSCACSPYSPYAYTNRVQSVRTLVALDPEPGDWQIQLNGFGQTYVVVEGGVQPVVFAEVLPIGQTRTITVRVPCRSDVTGPLNRPDGVTDVGDLFAFLALYFGGEGRADVDRSGSIDVGDIFRYLDRWFAGC
jgi:hypothetical protein